ncbi:MAG: hypothetical protein R3B07_33520 [Polyangiaceae bacterium]
MRSCSWLGAFAIVFASSGLALAQGAPPPPPPPPGDESGADAPAPPPADVTPPPPPPAGAGPAYPAYGDPPPPPPGPPPQQGGAYEPAPPPPPPIDETRGEGVHNHDGLYVRFGLGGGYMTTDVDSTIDFKLKGGAGASHLLLGGTPGGGFVIGGGFFTINATNPDAEIGDTTASTSDLQLSLAQIALFGDWFPDPHGGFHVGLGVGPAAVVAKVDKDVPDSEASSTGFAGTLFLGYDFWVGDDWSIGGLLSFMSASTKNTDSGADETLDTKAFTLQFTALYH